MLIRPQLLTIIILILLNPFLYLYILIPELANFFSLPAKGGEKISARKLFVLFLRVYF